MRAGLHVNDDRGIADAVAYCAEVQPAAMKWMDPKADTLIACRRASPKTRHIIRTHWSDQTLERYPSFINANLDRLRGLLAHPELRPDADGPVLWVEGYNEHVTKDTSTSYIRDFAGKEVKLAKAVNALGAGCLMGGCSTGFLEEVHLHAFKEVLDYCQANPKAAGFHTHEYAGPYVQYMWNTPGGRDQWTHPGGPWTGWSANREAYYTAGLWGWLTLRFVRILPLLQANGWGNVWLAITESGCDDTPPRPGPAGNGWMDFDNAEWAGGPVGDFADQMHCYLWQISHHKQVRFVVDFGYGSIDERWKRFDLARRPDMLARMKARMRELPIGHFGDVVLPTPLPPTQPDPRPAPVPIPRPAPAPAPVPPTTGSAPASTLGVVPMIQVLKGDGWTSIARRALGREPKVAEVTALRGANAAVTGLTPGAWLRSPFHRAVLL